MNQNAKKVESFGKSSFWFITKIAPVLMSQNESDVVDCGSLCYKSMFLLLFVKLCSKCKNEWIFSSIKIKKCSNNNVYVGKESLVLTI